MPRLFVLLAAITIAGCSREPGQVYPVAAADVRTQLEAVEVPTFIFGSAGVSIPAPISDDATISWPVKAKGQELFRYVATVTPVDATHTRVAVALTPVTGSETATRTAQGIKDNPDIARLYRDAMVEAVDAKLNGREFAMASITPALTLATIGHLDDIKADFDRAAEQYHKEDRSNLERAYAAQGLTY